MDFDLTDDQREIQRTARELLAERARPERVREHAEAGTHRRRRCGASCASSAGPGSRSPRSTAARASAQIELSILCEELGRSLAPVPFLPSVMAATVIEQAGSAEQRERWLPGLASGETIGALGAAVDGTAELVIGGAEADVFVLVDDDGSGRAGQPRGSRGDRRSPRSTRPARLRSVSVADGCRRGARTTAPAPVSAERWCRSAPSSSASATGRWSMTVEYVKDRKQFGVPVGAYQAVSHRCAQMLLETEKARSTAAFAAWTADADPEQLAEAAAMAKACASTPAARSRPARSRPTAGSASPGRRTCTGSTSGRSSTRRCSAAPSATVRGWPGSSPTASAPRQPPERRRPSTAEPR